MDIERRIDRLADLAERLQLLDRARQIGRTGTKFREQADVLDSNDGLTGEIRHQLHLLFGERANLLAIDGDSADQMIFLDHRHKH